MYQNCCKKCGSFDLFIEPKGNNTGLYCASCGTWQQWMNKNDIRSFEHNKVIKRPNTSSMQMRGDTFEERESVNKYIEGISKPTGINILENKTIYERLKEFVEFLDKKIDIEYENLPMSPEDAIRKNSYCLVLQQAIWALENILNGKDWNYKGEEENSDRRTYKRIDRTSKL